MSGHGKKMIAPIVITALFLLYLIVFAVLLGAGAIHAPLILLLLIPVMAFGGGMVYVLVLRIKEIRSGEEDDLSNY